MTKHPCRLAVALWLPSLLGGLLVVPFLLPFARWGADGRGDLPDWAWPWSTPNQRLPGDISIPAVSGILARYGRFAASWYWLGWRNPMQGWAAWFGVPVTMPWPPAPGFYGDIHGLWWERRPVLGGRYQLKKGWRTYDDGHGGWMAVPCWTVTKP